MPVTSSCQGRVWGVLDLGHLRSGPYAVAGLCFLSSSRSSYVYERLQHPRSVSVRIVLSYDVPVAYVTMRRGGLGHREVPLLSVGYFAPRLKGAVSPQASLDACGQRRRDCHCAVDLRIGDGGTRWALGTAQGQRITVSTTESQSCRLERSLCGDVHPTLDLSRPRVPSVVRHAPPSRPVRTAAVYWRA